MATLNGHIVTIESNGLWTSSILIFFQWMSIGSLLIQCAQWTMDIIIISQSTLTNRAL